jgi:ribosomal protein S27AE
VHLDLSRVILLITSHDMSLKPRDKQKPDFIALNIASDKRLFCNVCNGELLSDHSCGKCGIYYKPEEARHQVSIKGLDGREPGPASRTIPIAFIDSRPETKKQDMGGTFESLKKSGARITSYSESNV